MPNHSNTLLSVTFCTKMTWTPNWTDDKGTKHYAYEIVADSVQFLSPGRQQADDASGGQDDSDYNGVPF